MKTFSIKKYDYIDALRGFAIIGVIIRHSYQWITPSSDLLSKIAREGFIGVQLFFIASALTLFLSIHKRERSEKRVWLAFYTRRFFRIAPMFYLAIIVYWGGVSSQFWAPNGTEWWHLLLTLSFFHGWHPETFNSLVPGGWTIAVEMTFYLCIPILVVKLNSIKTSIQALLISFVLCSLLSRSAEFLWSQFYPENQQYLVDFFASSWFFVQLPVFVMGIILYHLVARYPHQDKQTGLILLLLSFYLFAAFIGIDSFANLLPQSTIYSVALAMFALALHFNPVKLLVNPVTEWIGKLSFSIYLVHFMVIEYLREIIGNQWHGNAGFVGVVLLVLIISSCVSFITYKFIELPGIALGKRLIQRY